MQGGSIISVSPSSPSFNTYDDRVAEIAARVVQEFRQESGYQVDDDETWPDQQKQQFIIEEEEDEFEFAFVCNKSPVSADEIFYKGQIKPTYPVYSQHEIPPDHPNIGKTSHRLPLGKLMKMSSEDPETASLIISSSSSSSSSSCKEADELEKVKPGSYCVWTPKADTTTSSRAGGRRRRTSNRWKLRELLYNTNGKDNKAAVCSSSHNSIMGTPEEEEEEEDCGTGNYSSSSSKRDMKSSFLLPNKLPDLLGIFSNINGFSRHLHPF